MNMDLADASKTQREANPRLRINKLFPQGGARGEDTDLASPVMEPPRSGHVWRTLISIHPALWGFRYRSSDEWAKDYYNTSLAFVVAEMRKLNTCNVTHQSPQQPVTPNDVLMQFLFCSPVYRQLLIDAAKTLLANREDEKNHIINLRAAMLAEKLLGFLGFRICLLLSQSGARTR